MNNWQKHKIIESREHQNLAFDKINDLVVKERRGKNIFLNDGTVLTEFMSCSYLGLDQDKRVVQACMENIEKCGVNFPVARTRLKIESFVILENLLKKIFNGHCITFSSLHITHLGIFPMIGSGEMPSFPLKKNGPLFIIDKKAHSSLQVNTGLLRQFGETKRIDFANETELGSLFKQGCMDQKTPIAIADGAGSMGGGANVPYLISLAEKNDGYIYLDDAHGVSIYGEHGHGYVLNCIDSFHPRLILAVSLSKGFGTNCAAIVVPTNADEQMIRQFAVPYLFSNPPPLSIVDASIASAKIHLSNELHFLQEKLHANVKQFDQIVERLSLQSRTINYGTQFPIRAIRIGDEYSAIAAVENLRAHGIAVTAAMYPTVQKGESILRMTFGADHTENEMKKLELGIAHVFENALL